MKTAIVVTTGVVLFFAMLFGSISYNSYVNRNKEHVYTAQEVYAIECAKRGGNPTTREGRDYSNDQNVGVQEFKCEGATDVRN